MSMVTIYGMPQSRAARVLWAFPAKLDLSKYPRVAEWLGRCTARPAFKG